MSIRNSLLTVAGISALLLLGGCSKLTQKNYNKLAVGMSYNQVTQLLGDPDNCSDTMATKSCDWVHGKSRVNVKFVGNNAILFSGKNLGK